MQAFQLWLEGRQAELKVDGPGGVDDVGGRLKHFCECSWQEAEVGGCEIAGEAACFGGEVGGG